MDRRILGIRDEKVREKLISRKSLDLQSAIDLCKSLEIASAQLKEMKEVDVINAVTNETPFRGGTRPKDGGKRAYGRRTRPSLGKAQEGGMLKCKFCCRSHEFHEEFCPAWDKKCNKCGNKIHFSVSVLCSANKGKVNALQDSRNSDQSSSDAEQIHVVETVCSLPHSKKEIYCTMVINGQNVRMQIDCGATVNVLPARYVGASEIVPDSITLQMWDKSTMKSLGKCKIKTVNPRNGHMYNVKYVIVKDDSVLAPLISTKAAVKMGLITINYDPFQSVNVVNAELNFCDVFPEVFDGKTGSLPGGAVHMTLTGDAAPPVRPARRIPETLKESAKIALEKLENAGKIKKVDSPTDWVNQMSLTLKSRKSLHKDPI